VDSSLAAADREPVDVVDDVPLIAGLVAGALILLAGVALVSLAGGRRRMRSCEQPPPGSSPARSPVAADMPDVWAWVALSSVSLGALHALDDALALVAERPQEANEAYYHLVFCMIGR
jgi:hypothetical protein